MQQPQRTLPPLPPGRRCCSRCSSTRLPPVSRGGSCMISTSWGIPAPDGRGHTGSARLPARLLVLGGSQAPEVLTEEAAPPDDADLFLADDRHTWAPSGPIQGLWQRLWLAMLICLRRTGQCTHSHQQSCQLGLWRHASWGTCGPPYSVTDCWWAWGCAGQVACAQRGTRGRTHG